MLSQTAPSEPSTPVVHCQLTMPRFAHCSELYCTDRLTNSEPRSHSHLTRTHHQFATACNTLSELFCYLSNGAAACTLDVERHQCRPRACNEFSVIKDCVSATRCLWDSGYSKCFPIGASQTTHKQKLGYLICSLAVGL